jgi:hypothetical protein
MRNKYLFGFMVCAGLCAPMVKLEYNGFEGSGRFPTELEISDDQDLLELDCEPTFELKSGESMFTAYSFALVASKLRVSKVMHIVKPDQSAHVTEYPIIEDRDEVQPYYRSYDHYCKFMSIYVKLYKAFMGQTVMNQEVINTCWHDTNFLRSAFDHATSHLRWSAEALDHAAALDQEEKDDAFDYEAAQNPKIFHCNNIINQLDNEIRGFTDGTELTRAVKLGCISKLNEVCNILNDLIVKDMGNGIMMIQEGQNTPSPQIL